MLICTQYTARDFPIKVLFFSFQSFLVDTCSYVFYYIFFSFNSHELGKVQFA